MTVAIFFVFYNFYFGFQQYIVNVLYIIFWDESLHLMIGNISIWMEITYSYLMEFTNFKVNWR